MLEEIGVQELGRNTITALQKFDADRIRKADRAAELMTKEARVQRRRQLLKEEEDNDNDYCPGGF